LAASRTADERYQDALVEYMEEERGHEKWSLDDIRAIGGNPDTVRDGQGGPACKMMVGYAYYVIEHISPHAFLADLPIFEPTAHWTPNTSRSSEISLTASMTGRPNVSLSTMLQCSTDCMEQSFTSLALARS
jgi:hypothetical protein